MTCTQLNYSRDTAEIMQAFSAFAAKKLGLFGKSLTFAPEIKFLGASLRFQCFVFHHQG